MSFKGLLREQRIKKNGCVQGVCVLLIAQCFLSRSFWVIMSKFVVEKKRGEKFKKATVSGSPLPQVFIFKAVW